MASVILVMKKKLMDVKTGGADRLDSDAGFNP